MVFGGGTYEIVLSSKLYEEIGSALIAGFIVLMVDWKHLRRRSKSRFFLDRDMSSNVRRIWEVVSEANNLGEVTKLASPISTC